MPNYRLDIAYDGSGFRGYAAQSGQRTIQGELEKALATYLKEDVATAVAGRTDAGVHARGQVVSFSYGGDLDRQRFVRGINGLVGTEVAVRSVVEVDKNFSARFSATWRRYRYMMSTGPPDPLRRGFVWQVSRDLDLSQMRESAAAFVGEHDFSAFCRTVEGKSNVRRVTELRLESDGEAIDFWIQANAFCHQMVRSIVGYLYDVGRGFTDGSLVEDVIASRDRGRVATVAPPHGLILWEVGYS
jgi:tRNA pseudouridine38-40 synthase